MIIMNFIKIFTLFRDFHFSVKNNMSSMVHDIHDNIKSRIHSIPPRSSVKN